MPTPPHSKDESIPDFLHRTNLRDFQRKSLLYGLGTIVGVAVWITFREEIPLQLAVPVIGGMAVEAGKNIYRWWQWLQSRPRAERIHPDRAAEIELETVKVMSDAVKARAWFTRGIIACIAVPSLLELFVGLEHAVAVASLLRWPRGWCGPLRGPRVDPPLGERPLGGLSPELPPRGHRGDAREGPWLAAGGGRRDRTRRGAFTARAALLYGTFRFEESGVIEETVDRVAGRYDVRITGRGHEMTTEIEATGALRDGRWAPLRFADRFVVYGRESRLRSRTTTTAA